MKAFNDFTWKNGKIDYGGWVQIVDEKSPWIIDDFSFETGIDEGSTNPHCVKCVAVNYCCFKNEDGKVPDEFDYASYFKVGKKVPDIIGIFHPRCHCKKVPINKPTIDEVNLLIKEGKIDWLYKDKIHWIHSWGYKDNEKEILLEKIYTAIKRAYVEGDYKIYMHDKYGVKITLYITLQGNNNHKGEVFKLKAGFTIFANKKLKCNTLVGGK